MARLGTFKQTPTERKLYSIDYEPWLDDGETVASVVYEVAETTTPPLLISEQTIAPGSLRAVFFVEGGVDQQQYQVLVTMTTSVGQIKEDFILFNVDAPELP
jgi:hypothetical protein